MNKHLMLCAVVTVLLICTANAELSACSSGGLTTSINKQFQMAYPEEDFLQVKNIDLLKEVSQLKELTCLQYMDATDRTIKGDIADLKNLKNLEVFSLYSNPEVYGDICSFTDATKLRSLKFAFDPLITGDVSCLKNLNKMETFAMTHTQISGDLAVFANMPNLKAIYIGGTNIHGDICTLSNLTNLEEFGIADEYPGNPNITGDLSCLNNLTKLTRVAIYNTKATNCEQFTQDHPNIEQGGCSKESMKTLIDYGQKYEKKIGKETQTEVKGQPNYQQNADFKDQPADKSKPKTDFGSKPVEDEKQYSEPTHQNFLTKLISWIRTFFGEASDKEITEHSEAGPEGCKTQAECDVVCSKPENQEACSKFAPPESTNSQEENPLNLENGGPGGCKTKAECQSYCSNPEHKDECSPLAPADEEPQTPESDIKPSLNAVSKLECRVSILPSSKGTAPYIAKVCIDNPNERIQQEYTDYVDFEGDGSWEDYGSNTHGCHDYNYLKPGTFYPKVKIVDANGIESKICQASVTVS